MALAVRRLPASARRMVLNRSKVTCPICFNAIGVAATIGVEGDVMPKDAYPTRLELMCRRYVYR